MPPARTTPSAIFRTALFLRSRSGMASPSIRRCVRRHLAGEPELDDIALRHLAALRNAELDTREHRRALETRHEVGDHQVRHGDTLDAEAGARVLLRAGQPHVI